MSAASGAVAETILERISGFGAALRMGGLQVSPDQLTQAVDALVAMPLTAPDSLYWSLRSTLVKRQDDLATFDRVFHAYWAPGGAARDEQADASPSMAPSERVAPPLPPGSGPDDVADPSGPVVDIASPDGAGDHDGVDEDDAQRGLSSRIDVLTKTFPEYSSEDYRRLLEVLSALQRAGPWRPRRRTVPSRRGRFDVRRTVRAGFQSGGDPLRQLRRDRGAKQRRLVVVCDTSGSMEPYARAVLTFAYIALRGRRRVEAFAFATRLTRITRCLLLRNPDEAIRAAGAAIRDWGGGTRVGDSLECLERQHRGALHGAVVLIASDGWDLGDPAVLSTAMAAIRRRAHAVVWVNPHLQDPKFEPLTRGMSAARPHVDRFLACHDAASLIELVAVLNRL